MNRHFNLKMNISKSKLWNSLFTPTPNNVYVPVSFSQELQFPGPKTLEPTFTHLFFFFTLYKNPSKSYVSPIHKIYPDSSHFSPLPFLPTLLVQATTIHYSSLLTGFPCLGPHPSNSLLFVEKPECFFFKY